jgi:hypothetical protein
MAQKIAEQLPKISVPHVVELAFTRAISERRRVSGWFRSCHGEKSKGISDERHLHFIGVLEGAFATLCPLTKMERKPGRARKPKPMHAESVPLHNAFATLTVEDPTNELEDQDTSHAAESVRDLKIPKIASVKLERTEDEIEEEFYFAIECFLEEVQAIRTTIKQTWEVYKQTGYDLVIATLTTNTAIGKYSPPSKPYIADPDTTELVRQAEDQLELLVERPRKYPAAKFPVWSFPAILFRAWHESVKSLPIEMIVLPSEGVAVMDGDKCLHADWCLYHAYSGIKFYLHRTRQCGKNADYALAAVSKESFQGRITENVWRAIEWTTILRAATVMSQNTFALDEITRGIRHAFATWTVPIWVSFGMQTLLDIQDLFDTSVDKAHKELQAHIQYASKMLEKDLDFRHPFPPRGNEQANTDRATSILHDIKDWAISDAFGSMLRQQPNLSEHPVLDRVIVQHHFMLRNHPLRCGMLKYDLYLQLHSTGIGVERLSVYMSMLAHLYAACKFSYPDDPVWPDMEFMIERQDPARLFLGALPKTFKEAHKKMLLAAGVTATNFARGRRNSKMIMNLDNSHCFEDRSVLGKLFQDRMSKEPTTKEANELTRKLIQAIQSSRKLPEGTGVPSRSVSTPSKRQDRDWKPLEILEEVREWLIEDGNDLYFDWFCMNRICADIWTKIESTFEALPGSTVRTGVDVRATAGYILTAGVNWEGVLEDNKDIRQLLRGHGDPALAPEISLVRDIMQATLTGRATPSNRPIGWLGDRCIRRLLHVNAEAIRPLGRPGGLNAKKLYSGWDLVDVRGSHVGLRLAGFVKRFEEFKKAEERYRKIDAGEVDCIDCGARHVPGEHEPTASRANFYFCSPITMAAWNRATS